MKKEADETAHLAVLSSLSWILESSEVAEILPWWSNNDVHHYRPHRQDRIVP